MLLILPTTIMFVGQGKLKNIGIPPVYRNGTKQKHRRGTSDTVFQPIL